MTMATAAQKRKIWMLASQTGMDEELLHSYIFALVHKDSIRKLNIREAVRIIDGLSGKDVRSLEPQREGMSYKQERYIRHLAGELGWVTEDGALDEKRLDAFCRAQYSTLYFRNLTRSKACKCIEAMKEMIRRQQKGVG